MTVYRTLCAVADRQHPYRQRPHRAVQLAVRPEATAAASCCVSTTPTSARSRQEYADADPVRPALAGHSSRRHRVPVARASPTYAAAVERLQAAGVLYPCYETRGGTRAAGARCCCRGGCRRSTAARRSSCRPPRRAALEAAGRKPHWRFLLPNFDSDPFAPERTEVHWNDLVRGPETVDLASVSDPVLVREDGSYLYTLPSVVDDIELGISPCHPRRRPCHQHRRADRAVRSAGRRAAGLRPPQSADHDQRRGAVEAQRRAVDRQPCAKPASSRWRWRRSPC